MSARRGQTILEYTIIVGIVTMVLFYMGTAVKRGVQSLVKVTADQVGNQQNADQDFNDVQPEGYMINSTDVTEESKNKQTTETGYIPVSGIPAYVSSVTESDYSDTLSNTYTNGGFARPSLVSKG